MPKSNVFGNLLSVWPLKNIPIKSCQTIAWFIYEKKKSKTVHERRRIAFSKASI